MNLKKLLLFSVMLVLALFNQVYAATSQDAVKAAIVKYSIEMGVDPAITLSIAKVESGYRHDLRSSRGAVGVFQLLPSTARRMGLNPYSLDDNIKGGIMYYKSMYKMFGSMQLAIAAYNAGPANVKKYNSVPPFRETKTFVSKIMSGYYYLKAHTDPSVTAYYSRQKAAAQKLAEQKAKEQKIIAQKTSDVKSHEVAAEPVLPVQSVDNQIIANVKSDTVVKHAPLPKQNISSHVLANAINDTVIKHAPLPAKKSNNKKSRKYNIVEQQNAESVDM